MVRSGQGRELCVRCARPMNVCVCEALPAGGPIQLRTKIMVLQHPLECRKVLASLP
jgi:DTW domain-containing protein YfiP